MASSRIASRDVVIPPVKESQILTLLYANSTEYFPVDLQQYQLVYRIITDVEEEGEQKRKLMVLAVPHDMIELYQKLAADCELSLEALDYVGNAATQILTDRIREGLYAAVKIEDDTTLVTIVRDGKIQLQRNFSYGIEDAVNVLRRSELFEEEPDFWEALKRLSQESFCDTDREDARQTLAEDLEESFRAIIGNVYRVISFYSSNNSGAEMESVVLYGMGAEVQDLRNALQKELNAPVTSEPLREKLLQEKSDSNREFSPLTSATCVGAAIEPMDFRLEEREKKKKEKKKEEKTGTKKKRNPLTAQGFFKLCIAAALLLLLAVIPYYIFLRADVARMQKERREKQYIADMYADYEKSKKEYGDMSKLYKSTETTSEGIGAFLSELEKKMPSSIAIRSLTSDSMAVTIDFNVKTKREAAKVIDEIAAFDSIDKVMVDSLEETRDELNNATVNCVISCTYVGGTAEEAVRETTAEEDVDALMNGKSEQSASGQKKAK